MLLKNKLEILKTYLNNDNVLTKIEERYCYSKDASNLCNNGKVPDLVVFVESVEEIQKIVKYANQHDIPIVSRGAGTNMVGACVCTRGGIVLNFSKMNKILDINTVNMTATVQPGVILKDLKDSVDKLGLFYPPDPSNYKVSTVGGSIAQSSGGARALKYGTTKDYVLSLKIVTASGEIMTVGAETPKDASGYHLTQLLIGSEGTLGIIVEATLKLIPKPEATTVILAYFDNIENAIRAVEIINSEHISPSAIDFMDQNSLITSEDFIKNNLRTNYKCMLLIELDGNKSSISARLEKLYNILQSNSAGDISISQNNADIEKMWEARRISFAATSRLAPDVISDDIIVPRQNLVRMIKKCEEVMGKYDLKMCLVGHIGDGNLHPQIALNLENELDYQNFTNAKAEIYNEAIKLGGTISAEHGIGIEKLSFFEQSIDKTALEFMKVIKKAFDPKNILNPDKIFRL